MEYRVSPPSHSLYLPTIPSSEKVPVLTLRLRSGQAKEGNWGIEGIGEIVNECVNTYRARMRYNVMTDDIQFRGVSLNMKYQF